MVTLAATLCALWSAGAPTSNLPIIEELLGNQKQASVTWRPKKGTKLTYKEGVVRIEETVVNVTDLAITVSEKTISTDASVREDIYTFRSSGECVRIQGNITKMLAEVMKDEPSAHERKRSLLLLRSRSFYRHNLRSGDSWKESVEESDSFAKRTEVIYRYEGIDKSVANKPLHKFIRQSRWIFESGSIQETKYEAFWISPTDGKICKVVSSSPLSEDKEYVKILVNPPL